MTASFPRRRAFIMHQSDTRKDKQERGEATFINSSLCQRMAGDVPHNRTGNVTSRTTAYVLIERGQILRHLSRKFKTFQNLYRTF